MSTFTKEIQFKPAYDKRHADPKKNYGVHGVTMRWILKGPLGAIQFVVYTNWQLPHVQAEMNAKLESGRSHACLHNPMPADLGYHSPKPLYEDQSPMSGKCDVLDGKCYYAGSGLNAEPIFQLLVEKGHEAVWTALEQEYAEQFQTP